MSYQEHRDLKKPIWLKVDFPSHQNFFYVSGILQKNKLNTICKSAKCPNSAECWAQKTATFLILGDTCTRNCGFCAVKNGTPELPIKDEAERISDAVSTLGLEYVVITSVTRDDLPDGGASHFVDVIEAVKGKKPKVKVEVLIPDFSGSKNALITVIKAAPEVINHNLEVPEAFYPLINRPEPNYRLSLEVLQRAKELGAVTKSGIMVGLGENKEHLIQTFSDLGRISCDLLTIGQYLRPSKNHLPVLEYYPPVKFQQLKQIALDFGIKAVESGPLVRSSYNAQKMYDSLRNGPIEEASSCAI